MKTPYISNYVEEFPLQSGDGLFYDNATQINYIDNQKSMKVVDFNLGPDTTSLTETTENDDRNYLQFGPDTTQLTKSLENVDLDNYLFGPDTTIRTFKIENNDDNIVYAFGPDTTISTRTIENSDSN